MAPAALVAIYYLFALSLDPLHGAWYLLMLVTGHSVGIVLALIGCLMLAAACGTAEIAWRPPDEDEAEQGPQGPAVYGPGHVRGTGFARRHAIRAPALTGRMSGFRNRPARERPDCRYRLVETGGSR